MTALAKPDSLVLENYCRIITTRGGGKRDPPTRWRWTSDPRSWLRTGRKYIRFSACWKGRAGALQGPVVLLKPPLTRQLLHTSHSIYADTGCPWQGTHQLPLPRSTQRSRVLSREDFLRGFPVFPLFLHFQTILPQTSQDLKLSPFRRLWRQELHSDPCSLSET